MNATEIYKAEIEKLGERAQFEMAQEEATELALAVRKWIRKPTDKTFRGLAEEVADVEIMIEQIKMMLPDIQEYVTSQKNFKLDRLDRRIKENNFEG